MTTAAMRQSLVFSALMLLSGLASAVSVADPGGCTEKPTGTGSVAETSDCFIKFKFVFCAPGETCVDNIATLYGCELVPGTPPAMQCTPPITGPCDEYTWDGTMLCRTWYSTFTMCRTGTVTICHQLTATNTKGSTTVIVCSPVTCADPPFPCE